MPSACSGRRRAFYLEDEKKKENKRENMKMSIIVLATCISVTTLTLNSSY
jgi:hypothetical protein